MKSDDRREPLFDAAESKTPCMRGNSMRENRETQATPPPDGGGGRSGKAPCRTPDMHVAGESDGPIVPAKRANNAETPARSRSCDTRKRDDRVPDTAPEKRDERTRARTRSCQAG